jgi:hypothetical protein
MIERMVEQRRLCDLRVNVHREVGTRQRARAASAGPRLSTTVVKLHRVFESHVEAGGDRHASDFECEYASPREVPERLRMALWQDYSAPRLTTGRSHMDPRERLSRFRVAKKGRNPASDCPFKARSRVARRRKIFLENTMDLQWKKRANYNASLRAGLEKSAGARTIKKQWKTMRRAIGTVGHPGQCLRPFGPTSCPRPSIPGTLCKLKRPPPKGAGRGFPSLGFQP